MKLYIQVDLGKGYEEIEFTPEALYTKCNHCGQKFGLDPEMDIFKYGEIICDACSYKPPKKATKDEILDLIRRIGRGYGKDPSQQMVEEIYERCMQSRLETEEDYAERISM